MERKQEILNKLIVLMKELISRDDIDYSKINFDTKLVEDLSFDSISLLMMALAIEKEFDIELKNMDIKTFSDVNKIITYIEKNKYEKDSLR